MAKVFLFILKKKHKTLHVKWAWVELENFAEKHSARISIDRARQNCTINSTVTRFQLYIKSKYFKQVYTRLKHFDHDLLTLKIEVLIHLNIKS